MTSRQRAAEALLPSYVSWLTPTHKLETSSLEFETFQAVYAKLHFDGTIVRAQTSSSNCVLFAAWTAIECLLGPLVSPPPFMKLKVPARGMPMAALHTSSPTLQSMVKLGLRTRMEQTHPISTLMVRRALTEGVVVAGLNINMFDDEVTHVRSKSVKRELLDKHGRASGIMSNSMIDHSVCIVGYVIVAGHSYFVTKDTQNTDALGYEKSGCSLLPAEEANVNELVIISAATAKRERAAMSSAVRRDN